MEEVVEDRRHWSLLKLRQAEVSAIMLAEVCFQRLWQRLGGRTDPSSLLAQLLAAYAQPHRKYHTVAHLEDCLQQFEAARGEAEQADEIEVALWFHDAVYEIFATDNEERSAAWAAQALREAAIDATVIGRVTALIEATKHDREPDTQDGRVLLDVDLSILGREPDVFAAYESRIREEYGLVPEAQFRSRRAAILESFLQRPAIFRTDFFWLRLEATARANLQWSIAHLRG